MTSKTHYKKAKCCLGEKSQAENHDLQNGKCSVCNYKISEGLEFTLNGNGSTYTLTGLGSCTDKIVCVPSSYEMFPVSAISSSAFNSTNVEGVVLSMGITNISSGTFANCPNLKYVSLPEGVKNIGSSAFQRSYSLEDVELPSTVVELGHGAFHECTSIKKIVIPDNCKTLVKGTFSGCTALTEVVLGDKTEYLGERTFNSCSSLRKITFGSSVHTILADAFANCRSLEEINFPSVNSIVQLTCTGNNSSPFKSSAKILINGEELTKLEFGEGIEVINGNIFVGIPTVKSIELPKSLKTLKMGSFVELLNCESIKYNGTVAEWEEVVKEPAWLTRSPKIKVIYCSDGEIHL